MGVLPYVVVVDEVLHLTQNHQRKGKKVNFLKTTYTLHQQTMEFKQLKQIAILK